MYPFLTGIPIHRDYHMTFFISDPLSILCPDIAVRQPVDSKFDITTNYDFLFIICSAREDIFRKLTNSYVIPIAERDMIYCRIA